MTAAQLPVSPVAREFSLEGSDTSLLEPRTLEPSGPSLTVLNCLAPLSISCFSSSVRRMNTVFYHVGISSYSHSGPFSGNQITFKVRSRDPSISTTTNCIFSKYKRLKEDFQVLYERENLSSSLVERDRPSRFEIHKTIRPRRPSLNLYTSKRSKSSRMTAALRSDGWSQRQQRQPSV